MNHVDELPNNSPSIDVYRAMKPEEVLASLHSDPVTGLGFQDVENRLKQYGLNEVESVKIRPLFLFLKKFWSLTAWLLEIMIVLSLLLKNYADSVVIAGLLVMNAWIGFREEQKADRAVDTLQNKLQVSARVLREKKWMLIPARELVPGDIVRLRAGDFIPADLYILDGVLEMDQSALTGESIETEVQVQAIVYSGSIVKKGEAIGLVLLTGKSTFFGKTTHLVQTARPILHVENIISSVIKWLLMIVGTLLGVVLLVSTLRGFPIFQAIPLALILMLSAIPVALPAMFTVSMAIGSLDLSKKNVLVTRLNAIEDAAAMDILCVDKTGTITINQLTIKHIIPFGSFTEEDVIRFGLLASEEANQDPIDQALIQDAQEKKIGVENYIREQFSPFDTGRRRTEALVRSSEGQFLVTKGSVPVILEMSNPSKNVNLQDLQNQIEALSKKGYRTLAVAREDENHSFDLVGIIALYDQPRKETHQLIKNLKDLSVSIKMLTGDALPIAREVAQEVGLGGNILSMTEIKSRLTQEAPLQSDTLEINGGFAEIFPEDKYTIVKSLQEKGHVVGMTGDGVNDAPALKQAEVGIAVRDAVDVAKGAASIVLTGEGLSGILELIKIGRMISQRITTWILSKISRTVFQALFIVLGYFWTGQYIVSAFTMILLLFVTDFVKIALSTDRVTISKKPETWQVGGMVGLSVLIGILMLLESLFLLSLFIQYTQIFTTLQQIQTFSFEVMFFFSIFSIFILREKRHFWNSIPSPILLTAISLDIALAVGFTTFGLPGLSRLPFLPTILIALYAALCSFLINDFLKVLYLTKKAHPPE